MSWNGTLLTGSDENAKTTQVLMRHANAGITMNVYAQDMTPAKLCSTSVSSSGQLGNCLHRKEETTWRGRNFHKSVLFLKGNGVRVFGVNYDRP